MLGTLYKIGGVYFRLIGTNGFHVKTKNAGSRCRQNLKYENFTPSFARLRQNIAPKGRTCSTINFPHSTNQIMICDVVVAVASSSNRKLLVTLVI